MGLLMDTLEDNFERQGVLETVALLRDTGPRPASTPPPVRCPVCKKMCASPNQLERHFARDHANLRVRLRVNGQIVTSYVRLVNPIQEVRLLLLGIPKTRVSVHWDGGSKVIDAQDGATLDQFIPPQFQGCVSIHAEADVTYQFALFVCQQPSFRREAVDKLVFALMSHLNAALQPDLDVASWRARFTAEFTAHGQRKVSVEERVGLDMEQQYFDGFLSYAQGCALERQGRFGVAKHHLDTALSYLACFDSMTARTVRCILSLKLNHFDPLSQCGQTSPFTCANHFFNRPDDKPAPKPAGPEKCVLSIGVFADEYVCLLLNAIDAFYARDLHAVHHIAAKMDRIRPKDSHIEYVQVMLLKARAWAQQGQKKEALHAYEGLRDDVYFGEEAVRKIEELQQ